VTPPLLAALRAGTADLHARAEAAFVLGAPGVTRREYAAVLARLHAFYAAAEAAVATWADALAVYGLDLAPRRKAPLLARDLLALGERPAAAAAARPLDLPTPAHVLGALYVLEGATLGGQLLRRRLGPALGLAPERGLAFFSAYGAAVGPMWRRFGEAVARFDAAAPEAEGPIVRAHAVAGARATFAAFEREVVLPTARPAAAPRALAGSA
jgi:heme oxygenase